MVEVSAQLTAALNKEGIGTQWWKRGTNGRGQTTVGLDLSIKKGLALAERFLQYPNIQVEILTLIAEEDYMELGLSDCN